MRRQAPLLLPVIGLSALGGCALLGKALGLLNVLLLGVVPTEGFSNPDSADYGLVKVAVSADDGAGLGLLPSKDEIEIRDEDGEIVPIEETDEHEGYELGSAALLVDGSASMLDTDPERYRVEAAKELSRALYQCSKGWRLGLFEFSDSMFNAEVEEEAGFGATPLQIEAGADRLGADGGTPLWDAAKEMLKETEQDARDAFPGEKDVGATLIIISDGADTSSSASLSSVIEKAQETGVTVHVIGVGPSSDSDSLWSDPSAVEDLRRLAEETGGTYGFVDSAADLPTVARSIAQAQCGGWSELAVRWPDPPSAGESVRGTIGAVGGVGLPFSFTAR